MRSSCVFKDEEMFIKKSRRVRAILAKKTSLHGVTDTRSRQGQLQNETEARGLWIRGLENASVPERVSEKEGRS